MHLKVQKRNGRAYLSVVQNYRQAGKTKTRTIETIGYADAYEDRFDDPIAHFRDYVAQLNAQAALESARIELSFGFDEAIDATAEAPARLGASVALGCLDAIGVHDFFHARAGRKGCPHHAGRIFEMLATERMMHAASKRESWTARDSFPRSCDFSYEDVYAALPYFAHQATYLDSSLMRTWANAHKESSGIDQVYVACGSYAFPATDETVHASVAVALDGEGIPLAYHGMPGRLSAQRLREAVDDLRERTGAQKAVVIAGGLRHIVPTMDELSQGGDGFVLFQPDFDDDPGLSAWIGSDEGYAHVRSDTFMKSRLSQRTLMEGREVPVREVVLRGGGYSLRQSHALLVSSETGLSPAAIVQLFREIWRQAEPFQPLEADFSAMPHAVSDADHIAAHFAICYAAFFALRVLRWKMGWRYNAADTADALLRMEGVHLQRNYYLFNYRSPVTDAIEDAVGIPSARRVRSRADLRSVPTITCNSIAAR